MKKSIALIIALSVYLLYDTSTALGCRCQVPDNSFKKQVKGARKQADIVFSGKVIETTFDKRTRPVLTTFRVEEYWKGAGGDEITLVTFPTTCSYFFDMDKSYLVYANSYENEFLDTSICHRTQRLEGANREIKILKRLREAEAN
ncbi:MAG TPA: hypothetical protein VF131_20790 [Blastocatellia bacterium]|nr:hypothetical protein [Blastocatellia bacterium]